MIIVEVGENLSHDLIHLLITSRIGGLYGVSSFQICLSLHLYHNNDALFLFFLNRKNNILEHVVDNSSGFPIFHLQEVTGKGIFTDENSLVTL